MAVIRLKIVFACTADDNLTNCCDDSDAVEESSSKGPGHGALIFLAIPALLLHSDDQLLLELLQAAGDLAGPVLLVQHLHLPVNIRDMQIPIAFCLHSKTKTHSVMSQITSVIANLFAFISLLVCISLSLSNS